MTPPLKLFAPDIFSNPVPRFSKLDDAQPEARAITNLLAGHYTSRAGAPVEILQSGGLELNSRNFRVTTGSGRMLLKRLALSVKQKAILENQQALVAWLKNEGAPVPAPIRSDEGTYLCKAGDGVYWMAMDFVDGHLFSGARASVANVGSAIGRFHKMLRAAPDTWPIDRHYAHLSGDDQTLFREVLAGSAAVLQQFSDSDAGLLEENRQFLAHIWRIVLEYQDDFLAGEAGLIHIDLHPHNLLLQDDRVAAFIDLDSLMYGPLNIMLGFSAYKLLRQVVQAAAAEMVPADYRALTADFLDSFYDEILELRKRKEDVPYFAMSEVCRRIAIIFRLTLRKKNTAWNHVLKIHIAGLREIELLFGLQLG